MTTYRRGEKIGWIAGWVGAFIWVAILSVVFLYQGKFGRGLLGVGLTAAAIFAIFSFAPWRYPSTPYWKLMLAPYGMFFISIAWAIGSYGGLESLGFNFLNLLWIVPALSPFGFLSNRKWVEFDAQKSAPPDASMPRR